MQDSVIGILDNAQTYLGILATFVALCLFVTKTRYEDKAKDDKNDEVQRDDDEDRNNFIFCILLKISNDITHSLTDFVEELKRDVQSIYVRKSKSRTYGDDFSTSIEKSAQKEELLSANRLRSSLVQYQFVTEATKIIGPTDFGKIKLREELSFVALFTLFLIISVFVLDCSDFIDIKIRCVFINLLLILSSGFLFILYHKYYYSGIRSIRNFPEEKYDPEERLKHPKAYRMWLGMSIAFAVWLLAIVPYITSAALSIMWFIAITVLGAFLLKGKWVDINHRLNRYTRLFVLSHFFKVAIISIILSLILIYGMEVVVGYICEDEYSNLAKKTVILLSDRVITKYFIIYFFTLNCFVLPFLIGWLPVKVVLFCIKYRLRRLQKEFQNIIKEYDDEFKRILRGVVSAENNKKESQSSQTSESTEPKHEAEKPIETPST